MYQLIDIINDDATRFLKLENVYTGVIDEYFDDSELVGEKNFSFMRIGQRYNCKIKLFGRPMAFQTNATMNCKFIDKKAVVGRKQMVEVQIGSERYYITKQSVDKYLDLDSFDFWITRKDLIQVDDIIHPDYL